MLVYTPREGAGALYKHPRVCKKRLPTLYWWREPKNHKRWVAIAILATINTTILRSSAVKCVTVTKILLVYTPREGAGALYKHPRVCMNRLPTLYWCKEPNKHKRWVAIAILATIHVTLLRSSAVKCVRVTKILLVYTPREGVEALYKHPRLCIRRFSTLYWYREPKKQIWLATITTPAKFITTKLRSSAGKCAKAT